MATLIVRLFLNTTNSIIQINTQQKKGIKVESRTIARVDKPETLTVILKFVISLAGVIKIAT